MSSDEEDDFVYNPLKLPMGWDGKPIPYWLYKLHGLNQVRLCLIRLSQVVLYCTHWLYKLHGLNQVRLCLIRLSRIVYTPTGSTSCTVSTRCVPCPSSSGHVSTGCC